MEGRPVRLAGQDSRRGTFVQRFATVIDRVNADEWTPLANLSEDQAKFFVYDSLLSEYAALGFEYGYSVARPDALVLWEAQFGDFVNGADHHQSSSSVDEFISSDRGFMTPMMRSSWLSPGRTSSHSLGEEHKPLIIFTPKSMSSARRPSQPSDCCSATARVDEGPGRPRGPLGSATLPLAGVEGRSRYPNLKQIRWVQDEPFNMGPWPNYAVNVWPALDVEVEGITRAASSSPSVGTLKRHTEEQKDLLARAFAATADETRDDY
jgi:2-oxoglutarate decarboxylase